jgi:hypothetical protein
MRVSISRVRADDSACLNHVRADNQPAEAKQFMRVETSARRRTAALRKSMAQGQLTRICRFTGRPGKASKPKNTGRKTQKRSELPSIFVSVRTHPDRLFSITYDRF